LLRLGLFRPPKKGANERVSPIWNRVRCLLCSFERHLNSSLNNPPGASEIICERGEVISREQKVAVVEAYLDCFATKDLSKVSFAEDATFEGPRMPKLTGRATVLGFLTQILPMVSGIQLKQHIVEGDYVATLFDMETVNGVDHVFDRIHIVDGQIKD
jgi:hypothetical protein